MTTCLAQGRGVPSILVDAAVSIDLVVLDRVSRLRLCVREGTSMLTPSMGFCATPLTVLGCGKPAASSTVGTTSIRW